MTTFTLNEINARLNALPTYSQLSSSLELLSRQPHLTSTQKVNETLAIGWAKNERRELRIARRNLLKERV